MGKGWRDIHFTMPVLAVLTQPQRPPMPCSSLSTIRKYRAEPRPLYCHRANNEDAGHRAAKVNAACKVTYIILREAYPNACAIVSVV